VAKYVELALPPGLTLTLNLSPLAAGDVESTGLEEQEDQPGRYIADVTEVAAGSYWYSAELSGGSVVDAARIVIGSADGTYTPSASTVSGFSSAALAQLAAADIEITTNPPVTGAITVVRGCDHLAAEGNGWSWRNAAGTWPDLSDRTITIEIFSRSKSIGEGEVIVASGENQEVRGSLTRTQTAALAEGRGDLVVVATDAAGNRYPLAIGVANVIGKAA
jgi:hypothetical protein